MFESNEVNQFHEKVMLHGWTVKCLLVSQYLIPIIEMLVFLIVNIIISNLAMFIFLYYVIIFAVQSLFALRQSEGEVWCQLHFDEVCCSIDQAAVALQTAPESKPLPSRPYISKCTKR